MDLQNIDKKDIALYNELSIVSTTVLWKIQNFKTIPKRQWIRSNLFFISGYALELRLKRSAACLYIYLFLEMPCKISGLHAIVSLIDRQGKPRFLCQKNASTPESDNMLLLLNITENNLGKPLNVLSNDTLTIRCNVSIEDDQKDEQAREHTLEEEPVNGLKEELTRLETLSIDFGKYYDAHMDCDVVLKADGLDFPTHQAILSARSPVLAEMLENDSLEFNPKTLDIPNIQPNILDNLLFYIYSGKVRGLTSDTATQMFSAADKFTLTELKYICLTFIHSNLTVENVGDVALLAETQDNKMLKEDVEKFIINNVTNVLQSRQWKEFTQQQYVLANAILSNVLLATAKAVN